MVPKQILNRHGTAIAGAVYGKWACCGFPDGYFYVWQMKTSNLNEPLESTNQVVKFALFDYATINSKGERIGSVAPLMSLSPSQGDNESVHLYVLNPLTGDMTMIKISRRDLSSESSSAVLRTRSPHKVSTRITDDYELLAGETFVTLTTEGPLVVVGTSRGTLFLIKYVAIPSALHPQKVEATRSGLLNRIFGKSSQPPDENAGDQTPHVLSLSATDFLSVSSSSGIVHWSVEEKLVGGQFATFQPDIRLANISEAMAAESWSLTKILVATLTPDHKDFHAIVQGEADGESRLYWVVFDVDGELIQDYWLSRFATPAEVDVLGVVACEDGTAYAAFAMGGSVVSMVLLPEDSAIQEVDLPPRHAPGLFPGMMKRDMATHGCFMVATTGIALRTRYLATDSQATKRTRLEEDKGISTQTLVTHLRSYFWQTYQNQGIDQPMPPSLRHSSNREQAVLQFALELQEKGNASSYGVVLEWHHAYLKTLQDCGLYRCLSSDGKWKLFSVGQELSAFAAIAERLLRKYEHYDLDWISRLTPNKLGEWFWSIQEAEENTGWKNALVWHDILEESLGAIWTFQEIAAGPMYDIASDYGPIDWISRPAMQKMLRQQMRLWTPKEVVVSSSVVELVAKTALRSFYGSWREVDSEKNKSEFEIAQKRAISLLRSSGDGLDEKAFELCRQYNLFDGLCEISLAHERKADAQFFSLASLFNQINAFDPFNNLSFPSFVLQWHAQEKLYGHVLNYGLNCNQELNLILERNDELRQYRWINFTRQMNSEDAAKSCLQNTDVAKGIENIEWNLNFAKLSNKLAPSKDRQQKIERTLETAEAQMILCEGMGNEFLLPSTKLIEIAIEKLGDKSSLEDQVEVAVVALTLCSTLTDEGSVWENKVKIWSELLLLNGAMWSDWARGGFGNDIDFVKGEALDNTVFGLVLRECRNEASMARVTYGRDMETEVIDRVQDENHESFTRLLRAVADPPTTGTGESMVVSSF